MRDKITNLRLWQFGGPSGEASTLRAEGDKLMAEANEFYEASELCLRKAKLLEVQAITAWAKAEAIKGKTNA